MTDKTTLLGDHRHKLPEQIESEYRGKPVYQCSFSQGQIEVQTDHPHRPSYKRTDSWVWDTRSKRWMLVKSSD